MGALAPGTVAAARRTRGPILVESAADFDSEEATNGVLLALDRAGIRAGRSAEFGWQVGTAHVVTPTAARTTYLVAVNAAVDRYRRDARYRRVAGYDELRAAERAEVERIRAAAPVGTGDDLATLRRWIRRHSAEWKRFTRLEARGDRAAVYEVVRLRPSTRG